MNKKLRNKIKGSLYGFAIGDSMGAATEFMTAKQIKETYGKVEDIIGGGAFGWLPGEVTDDTQMTFCVIDALMSMNKKDAFGYDFMIKCRNNFIDWKNTNPKDIGNQCSSALSYIEQNKKLADDREMSYSQGNGSLMRALPCALVDSPFLNEAQSKITHNNKLCTEIVLKYHNDIQNILIDNYCYDYNKTLCNPTGWVIDTYNNALYWLQEDSFYDSIVGAVNHGGDADTIAAITGSLAGARFGYDAIPERWINQLNDDVKEKLEKFYEFVIKTLDI